MNLSKTGKYIVLFAMIFAVNINIFAVDNWVKVTSHNFQLVGNAEEKDIRKVAVKLEQFRLVFTKVHNKMQFDSPIPTTVIVFKNENSFRDFKPVENGKIKDWVAGFFQSGQDVNYIALSIEADEAKNYRIVFHEYTHYLIGNTFGLAKVPTWLNEGLAEYYENIEINDQKVRYGELNKNHLKLLQEKELIPFEDFLKVDYSLLDKQNKDAINLFYAQSWALIHYLIHGNSGARKARLTNFLDLLMNGKKSDAAFTEAFQINSQKLENDLKKYISQKSFQATEITLKNKLELNFEIQTSAISEAEAKAFQGDLLFKMNRFDEAERLLEEALSIDPKLSFANISLGLVKMKKRDFGEAKRLIENAIAADPENYSAQYNYAFVLSREEMSEGGIITLYSPENAEKMRQSLRKAIFLNPKSAEPFSLFAFISIVQNDFLDEGLAMIEKALEIEPQNQMFVLRKSEILMLKKDFQKSKTIAGNIFKTATDEQIRNFASNTLEKINNYEKQIERIRKVNEANPYVIKEDKPLTVSEIEELYKRIEIDSINENLRKLESGEQRVVGKITKIDCVSNSVVYWVESKEQELKFINKGFKGIIFFTYKIELKGGAIGCESDLSKFISIITFKSSGDEKNQSNGEIVAVEFVPDYFVFAESKKGNK